MHPEECVCIRCCGADKVKLEDKPGEAKHTVYFHQIIKGFCQVYHLYRESLVDTLDKT